jgi:hypothetical protein
MPALRPDLISQQQDRNEVGIVGLLLCKMLWLWVYQAPVTIQSCRSLWLAIILILPLKVMVLHFRNGLHHYSVVHYQDNEHKLI